MAAVGAAKPEVSSHLLIDVPEATIPGRLSATLRSELPATGALVFLRGAPPPAKTPPGAPVLIGAMLLRSGQEPTMTLRLEIERNETFTLLAFAQGRWFMASRQVKVGKPGAASARG